MEYILTIDCVVVGKGELKSEILKALSKLADNNDGSFCNVDEDDFNLCDEAEKKGFKSNRDYVIDKVSKIDDVNSMVDNFFEEWLGKDSFYTLYQYRLCYDENNNIVAIALAYNTEEDL